MTQEEMAEVKRWVTENLSNGFIKASQSPWASPILFVKKPGGGIRLCFDYRKLNAITKKDRYPIPLIDETMANIAGCKVMTKLDIRKAFNRIRVAESSEDLLTFCTPVGNFKPTVMGFGPCNGPATFQRYINETLFEYLNVFCTAYLDDVLIYSQNLEEHQEHVKLVLQRLMDAGLEVDIRKCEFHVTKTKFLGLIVSTNGLEMDPEKIEVVKNWEVPTNITEAQGFIGFCNFYRRFIEAFSKVMRPIIELTKKELKFEWNMNAQKAFDEIKQRITSAPVLVHFDHTQTAYVEADSSDYVQGGVLSQMKDGILHPVAFFSRKLSPAECNYEIYDKELLAIVNCLEHWRPELEGTKLPIQILTDHKALEYFMTSKKLTRRQARWALTLANYNFQIAYRPGKANGKADALTRKPGDRPTGDTDERQKYQFQTILTAKRIHPSLRAELETTAEDLDADATEAELALVDYALQDEVLVSPIAVDEELPQPLEARIKEAQSADDTAKRVVQKLTNGDRKDHEVTLAHAIVKDGKLYIDKKLWVPESARTEVIEAVHSTPETGHPGLAKTLFHLQKSYYWPYMHREVSRYLRNCHTCRQTKAPRDKQHGLLNPLPIADRPWKHISMDFVTHLPKTLRGYNAIAAIVCRLTKRRILEPMIAADKGTDAMATAKLVYLSMRRQGVGLIDSFVSDRGPQWDCEFWEHLCRLWKIQRMMSTAFHPETDGQTEIVNQETERFVRAFTNYQQDDWDEWLPEAEAAMNSNPSATTGVSPFMGSNGYEPEMSFDLKPDPAPLPPANARDAKERQRAERFAKEIENRSQFLKEQIALAQSRMAEAADRSRQPSPNYQTDDYVWLSLKNIQTIRPMKKLDYKNVRCKVIERIGRDSYRLELPEGMSQLHDVFHTSLLRPDPNDPLPGQRIDPPPPIQVQDEDNTHDEWEVEEILDSRWHYGHLEYKVKWKGYPLEPRKWYRATLFDNALDATAEFHSKYPDKPKPRPQGLRITQVELDEKVNTRNKTRERSLATRRSARQKDKARETSHE
jgi:hypothetical protein